MIYTLNLLEFCKYINKLKNLFKFLNGITLSISEEIVTHLSLYLKENFPHETMEKKRHYPLKVKHTHKLIRYLKLGVKWAKNAPSFH